ncbi:hypothetical protein F5Y11DRAFT_348762 [Daldinia sp. FL1419]|nr:hypothetical protein F5Y11DRAFT_348762 [Daldinia sp. FL1419]
MEGTGGYPAHISFLIFQAVSEVTQYVLMKPPLNPKDEFRIAASNWSISYYDTRYFVPQWDEQLLGPDWEKKRGDWDYDKIPKPLPMTHPTMKDAFKYCEKCQLTWVVGHSKLEGHHHPQHIAWDIEAEGIPYKRLDYPKKTSIIIHVHSDTIAEGQTPKVTAAGLGVFFGKSSKYNIAARCRPENGTGPTAEVSELSAISLAISKLKVLLVRRKESLSEFGKSQPEVPDTLESHSEAINRLSALDLDSMISIMSSGDTDKIRKSLGDPRASISLLSSLLFRVIIISDNAEVVEELCKPGNKGQQWNKKDPAVRELYHQIDDTINTTEKQVGVTFKFYCVPKESNNDAAMLARIGLRGRPM